MESSQNTVQSATTKKSKTHRARLDISRKVIAFQEIIQANGCAARASARILHVPNSTMQSWTKQEADSWDSNDALACFFKTPAGAQFLQRIVLAAMYNNKCGHSGILGVQEFLHHSGLCKYVASSAGALQEFWKRCETAILSFEEEWKATLSKTMKEREITVITDEMFRKGKPCLVAIEALSNFILLEKFTENRKASTWKEELEKETEGMPVSIDLIVSDLCGALCSLAGSIGAEHSPDIFHGQYEISKATSAALASQERAAEENFQKTEAALEAAKAKPSRIEIREKEKQKQEIDDLEKRRAEMQASYEEKKERRERVQDAKKALGEIHHPIHLDSGKLRTIEELEGGFNQQFEVIETEAAAAKLSSSCLSRIAKAKRAFDLMLDYFRSFCMLMMAYMEKIPESSRSFFQETVFPLAYLQMVKKRIPKKDQEKIIQTLYVLRKRFDEHSMVEEAKQALMRLGKELAERFQRSSSSVEGRNGGLSLLLHRFHHIDERTMRVLTIVHNYGVRRKDGSTAASRFFGGQHADPFEHLIKTVRIPGAPRAQVKKKLKTAA